MACTEEHEELKRQLRTEHEDLKGKVVAVQESLDQHIQDAHERLLTRQEIKEMDEAIESEIEELACELLGKRRTALMGGGREIESSLKYKIETMYDQTQNGGIKVKVGKGVVTLLAAIITAVSYIGVAVITHQEDNQAQIERVIEQVDQRLDEFEQGLP